MVGAHVIICEDSAKSENETAVIDQAEGVAPGQGENAAILFKLYILCLKHRYTRLLAIENFIEPGAGLIELPELLQDSDHIFDSLFSPSTVNVSRITVSTPMVRTYESDYTILEAYYVYIHPFFPILPPPILTPLDRPLNLRKDDIPEYEPSSPIGLAIAAVLALIPCADDPQYQTQESLTFRRNYAHFLARSALESLESEKDIPEFINPSTALAEPGDELETHRFHPEVPQELEDITTLNILSFYEYAQRGNLKKMQSRAGQALVLAMALSLHECSEADPYLEIKARVWWMTYICVTQASIVSNSAPTSSALPQRSITKYPFVQADPEAFELLIQAQQILLTCTQFAAELVKAAKANGDMFSVCERMKALEQHVEGVNRVADTWILQGSPTSPLESTEEVVSRALRSMARIKLNSARIKIHRYCAFYDNPVFVGKYCDLDSKSPASPASSLSTYELDSPSSSNGLSSVLVPDMVDLLPFTRHQSTKICLKAALNIAQTFNDLPFPNPTGEFCMPPCYLTPTSMLVAPRLMPSLACCAMQCTYTLAMVHSRLDSIFLENGAANPVAENLLMRLRMGLTSISTIFENYATAFEALSGLRDQVRDIF
ncbi:hypothetical protein EG329_014270 [Mollisiaceae sp. DMI_Dod_QoI]|nr:hypothetical protein EG329_014270 [Helotiales sp. DMI_Dod_QoI]